MRIAYFSDNLFPEVSGISDSIITTGETLRARGHDVVYFGPWYPREAYELVAKRSGVYDRLIKLPIRKLPSLPMKNSPTGQSRIVIPTGASLPFLRRFRPDIIHTQSPFGVGLEALLASRVLQVPLVGTNHTMIEEFVPHLPLLGDRVKRWARRYFSWYYNRCVFITAPFGGLIAQMREMGLVCAAMPQANPISLEIFRSATPDERRQAKAALNEKGPIVFYSGRLAPEKQVDVLIEGFAKIVPEFPMARLYLAGHGSERTSLEALAGRLGVSEHVRFMGFVDHSHVAELCRAADVFALMSRSETQSLSLMQAFASSLPAVVSSGGALPHYTPDTCGFVIPVNDPGALAKRLRELFLDEELRIRMGDAAAEYVELFSPETVADAWEQTFRTHARAS